MKERQGPKETEQRFYDPVLYCHGRWQWSTVHRATKISLGCWRIGRRSPHGEIARLSLKAWGGLDENRIYGTRPFLNIRNNPKEVPKKDLWWTTGLRTKKRDLIGSSFKQSDFCMKKYNSIECFCYICVKLWSPGKSNPAQFSIDRRLEAIAENGKYRK